MTTPEESFNLLSSTLNRLAPRARPSIVPKQYGSAAEKALKKVAARTAAATECSVCGRSTNKLVTVAVWEADADEGVLRATHPAHACKDCAVIYSPTGIVDALASGKADSVHALARRCVEANYDTDADDIAVRKHVDLLEQVASTAYSLRVMATAMGEWSVVA